MLSFMTPNAFATLLRALFLALFVGPVHPLAAQTIALGQFAHADTERNDPESSKANVDLLLPRLASATPYHFVERAAVDRLIAEQSMSSEGFTRPDSAIRLGRLLRADLLLTGTFFTPSNKPPFVLLEVIETARAEVVAHTGSQRWWNSQPGNDGAVDAEGCRRRLPGLPPAPRNRCCRDFKPAPVRY